jgi:hypothetical protein
MAEARQQFGYVARRSGHFAVLNAGAIGKFLRQAGSGGSAMRVPAKGRAEKMGQFRKLKVEFQQAKQNKRHIKKRSQKRTQFLL